MGRLMEETLLWAGGIYTALTALVAFYRTREKDLKQYVLLTRSQWDDTAVVWLGKTVNGLTYVLDIVGKLAPFLRRKSAAKEPHDLLPGQLVDTIIAGGVKLVDLSEEVAELFDKYPRPANYLRDMSDVVRLYIHHTGASGASGKQGALNSLAWYAKDRKRRNGKPVWRGKERMPHYHLWLPREPDGDMIEIYQLAPFNWRCWHTGSANDHGIGLACQGNSTKQKLTTNQEEGLEAIVPWIQEEVLTACPPGEDWLSMHNEADKYGAKRKASCPGVRLTTWVKDYRDADEFMLDRFGEGYCDRT